MAQVTEATSDYRNELLFPHVLGAFERSRIASHGRTDARRGRVHVATGVQGPYLTSPYCLSLASDATYRIEAEWLRTNGDMFQLRPEVESVLHELDELGQHLAVLQTQRERDLAEASIVRDGDEQMSAHLARRRQARRTGHVQARYDAQESSLRSQARQAATRLDALVARMEDIRDVANVHERLVRADYLARLAAYARGASRYTSVDARLVNDGALASTARDESDAFFSYCMKRAEAVRRALASGEEDASARLGETPERPGSAGQSSTKPTLDAQS